LSSSIGSRRRKPKPAPRARRKPAPRALAVLPKPDEGPVTAIRFVGVLAQVFRDETRFVDVEGALNCGKTTACLWKEYLAAVVRWPGISSFICRFADGDNDSKLIPAWLAVCEQAHAADRRLPRPTWNARELCFEFRLPGDKLSKVYSFGIRPSGELGRYAKLRGLGVSRIYVDQAEELPSDYIGELAQRLRQKGFPHQLTLSPNPLDENSWLAEMFPENQSIANRKYYAVALMDNAHNLPAGKVEDALAMYPVTHAKHRSAILGLRGLNVIGKPVYSGAFIRSTHVRPLKWNPFVTLEEGIDFGKHHPCVVWRQRSMYGGVQYLGGVMGQNMYLDDFLPVVKAFRSKWFPDVKEIATCCDPAGSHGNSQGLRDNGVSILRAHGFAPRWRDDANRPSIRAAIMDRIAGQMRKRTPAGEAYQIEASRDRWMRVTGEGAPPASWCFLADGDEAGYVWDQHMVSEGSKQYRRAKKDGWYEHGQNCKEYLETNFGSDPVKAPERDDPEPERTSAWS